jgi:hypothetical protein
VRTRAIGLTRALLLGVLVLAAANCDAARKEAAALIRTNEKARSKSGAEMALAPTKPVPDAGRSAKPTGSGDRGRCAHVARECHVVDVLGV